MPRSVGQDVLDARAIIREAESGGRELTATERSEFDRLLDRAADRKSAADTQREVDRFSRELGRERQTLS